MRTLIIGYGNVDREDDGLAWHVLQGVIQSLGYAQSEQFDADIPVDYGGVSILFQLQLVPEFSELLADYDRVCFVDAHTGSVPEDVHFEELTPGYQHSPFTHHLTPNSLLAMTTSVYHKSPSSVLISVRGYEFGFSPDLSEMSASLVPTAVGIILKWLDSSNHPSSEGI